MALRYGMKTYIHNVVEDNKCGPPCLLFVTDTDLAYATITAEEIIQVLSRYRVVQILDKEYTVGARWQFGLWRH